MEEKDDGFTRYTILALIEQIFGIVKDFCFKFLPKCKKNNSSLIYNTSVKR